MKIDHLKTPKIWMKKLIANWNNTVAKEDIVYMLGDFTLSRNKEYIKSLLQRLNGKIILVMGNHDSLKPAQYTELGLPCRDS